VLLVQSACRDCQKLFYQLMEDGRCRLCNKINWQKQAGRERRVGRCRICRKDIYGKNGCFVAGVGSAHLKCAEKYLALRKKVD